MKIKQYYNIGLLCLLGFGFAQTVHGQQVEGADSLVNVASESKMGLESIAYGQQPAWKISSAMSTVYGADLQKNFVTSLGNTLFGRIPGLTVIQRGGEPGNNSPALIARGINTFGPGREILVIVDGFESVTFDQLVPDEIESISLLKDASATAIYGMRGANGVLLVTTKRGTNSPLTVNFSTQHGFQSPTRLPQFLGSYDYAQLFNEGLKNDGKAPLYTADDLEAYRTGSDPFFRPNVNWYNEVLKKTAPISNYDLNFRGGSNTVRYFVLLNAIRNNGLFKDFGDISDESANSRYARYNFRSNVDINLTKRLTASLTLGGTVEDISNPGGVIPTANITNNPNNNPVPIYASIFSTLNSLPPNSFPVYNEGGSISRNNLRSNPVADLLQTGSATSNGRTLQSTLKFTEQLDMITPGLSISAAVSFNSFFKAYSSKTKQYDSFSITKNVDGSTASNQTSLKTSLLGNEALTDQWRSTTFQGFLNYDRTFGNHAISGMLMYNSESYTNINILTTGVESFPYKHLGGGGRLTYANSNKYIAEFSFGYMGSENFAQGQRYGFFPAGSLGWIVSNENFLKDNTTLTYLKLRGSYGLSGNDQINRPRFLFQQRYASSNYYLGTNNGNAGTLTEGALANPDVSWEKEKKLNVGLELTLANQIDIGLDVFQNNRYDILVSPNRAIPQYIGVALPLLNQGKVVNRGFEATIRYKSKSTSQLQYFVEASGWYAQNKIEFNSEAILLNEYQYATNRVIDQPFGLEAIGLFRDQAEINNSARQTFAPVQPGDIKYKDLNNDGVIDQNDAGPIGKTSVPTLTINLHPRFQYKGFDLEFLFQGVTGVTSYLGGNSFQAFQNNGQVGKIALGRWTPETAESATHPRLSASNNLNNYRFSSFWQRDGSFINLRSLELGYSLPTQLIERIKLSKARIYINGTNLFSINHMEGYMDTEVGPGGYPALQTVSMGVRLQF